MSLEQSMIVARLINEVCPQYGINNPDILHEFIANVAEECGEFTVFAENLNYSVDALLKMFGRHRISEAQAKMYGRLGARKANQEAIANTIYGGEWGKINLGNSSPTDGWYLRGSGMLQLTGYANIGNFATYYNARFGTKYGVYKMAEMLRTNIKIGLHGACWFFCISKGLIDEAINDQMDIIVKKINGGVNGIEKRKMYYEKAKIYIV